MIDAEGNIYGIIGLPQGGVHLVKVAGPPTTRDRAKVRYWRQMRKHHRYGNQAHTCACGETFATKYGMRMHAEAMHP